jgi:putative glycosyltransferase (TIGR04348 family)
LQSRKKIVLISPALAAANNGNWHTAHRWATFAKSHCDIELLQDWSSSVTESHSLAPQAIVTPQAMVALHARRSAPSIAAWAAQYPDKPLVVVLTGTDLYRDIATNASAQQSLALATHLVVLQEAGLDALPAHLRHKARVIYQSAPALLPAVKSARRFKAVMVGHLRDEKDPLTFIAASTLSATANLHFDQIGDGLDADLATAAHAAARLNPRYRWRGGLPRAQTRQAIKRAHVLVNSSIMEGGAHVILEAVQSSTPVLASRISGNVGMLGADYAGYFEVGNAQQLGALLVRCAESPEFLALLHRQCQRRAGLFAPLEEQRGVLNLMHEITASRTTKATS